MPVHSDEHCDNTDERCPILGCNGCAYCCPKHGYCCFDCGCQDHEVGSDCDGECICHYDGPSDESLRREERRQLGITG